MLAECVQQCSGRGASAELLCRRDREMVSYRNGRRKVSDTGKREGATEVYRLRDRKERTSGQKRKMGKGQIKWANGSRDKTDDRRRT